MRFLDPVTPEDETANDAFTERVMAEIAASGEAFFTGTTWRGMRAMRVSVSSWRTTKEDVARVITAVGVVLRGLGW